MSPGLQRKKGANDSVNTAVKNLQKRKKKRKEGILGKKGVGLQLF